MKEPIVFKCSPEMWALLKSGEKTWDARRHDLADDRIYRLSWGTGTSLTGHLFTARTLSPPWRQGPPPDEPCVSFLNKATGEVLAFRYLGMKFTPWAPGWCFLLLGERLDVALP